MAETSETPKVRMACATCGSPQVTRDAWAEWDEDAQAWRLGAMFEQAWCHRCQRRARLERRAL